MIAFYWGLASQFAPALPLGGLIGAGFGLTALLGFGGRSLSGPSLILAGVALSSLAAALMSLTLTLAQIRSPWRKSPSGSWQACTIAPGRCRPSPWPRRRPRGVVLLLRLGPRLDASRPRSRTDPGLTGPAHLRRTLTSCRDGMRAGRWGERGGRRRHRVRRPRGPAFASALVWSTASSTVAPVAADGRDPADRRRHDGAGHPSRAAGVGGPASGRADRALGAPFLVRQSPAGERHDPTRSVQSEPG